VLIPAKKGRYTAVVPSSDDSKLISFEIDVGEDIDDSDVKGASPRVDEDALAEAPALAAGTPSLIVPASLRDREEAGL
jgi:hypothetical protein